MLNHFDSSAYDSDGDDRFDNVLGLTQESYRTTHLPVPQPKRKLRILALHGFGQGGEYIRVALKTHQLTQYLIESLDANVISKYNGVEWSCPDGPINLNSEDTDDDIRMRAWWRSLDFDKRHEDIYPSLVYLSNHIKTHGPFDGIVGFSQGATMATMLAAWCEGTPQRLSALKAQGSPLDLPPPQRAFGFAVSCCGFQTYLAHYSGFYTPKLTTPTLHFVAEFDTMVSEARTKALADACLDARVVQFRGSHYVPNESGVLREMAGFITAVCADRRRTSMVYSLPQAFVEEKVPLIPRHDEFWMETPSSLPSLTSSSSSSVATRRLVPTRLIRRSATFRNVYRR